MITKINKKWSQKIHLLKKDGVKKLNKMIAQH